MHVGCLRTRAIVHHSLKPPTGFLVFIPVLCFGSIARHTITRTSLGLLGVKWCGRPLLKEIDDKHEVHLKTPRRPWHVVDFFTKTL